MDWKMAHSKVQRMVSKMEYSTGPKMVPMRVLRKAAQKAQSMVQRMVLSKARQKVRLRDSMREL